MTSRRVALVVLASLVASLGVLTAAEVATPPTPAAAVPTGWGVSTLTGDGNRDRVDGTMAAARHDQIRDMTMDPQGAYLYTLEMGGSGRTNSIRKIDVVTGAVTTFASGGLLQTGPLTIEADSTGGVWVSRDLGTDQKDIVKFTSGGSGTVMLSAVCCGYYGGDFVGDAFHIDEAAGLLYYSTGEPEDLEPNDPDEVAALFSIPLASLPAAAASGTHLGSVPPMTRGPVIDMEAGPGGIYVVWGGVGMAKIAGGVVSLVSGSYSPTTRYDRIAFAPNSSSVYHVISQSGGTHGIGRWSDFGAGTDTVLSGATVGFADGEAARFRDPSGIALSPDGKVAYIADTINYRIRQMRLPPDPGELSAEELCGGCNPGQRRVDAPKVADPIDVATGNLTETVTDMAVPGRGPGAAVTRTYNSINHDEEGLFGFGWSSPLDMSVTASTGTVWVEQENGAILPFWRSSTGVITAPPRVTSTLEELSGGGWRLDRNHGDVVTFDAQGRVTGWEDRNGNVTTLTRPTADKIVMATSGSRTITFHHSGGRVAWANDSELGGDNQQRMVNYSYTAGRLTQVQSFKVNENDTGRMTWGYAYDTAGRLSSITDPRGNSNLTHYDSRGRADHQIDYAGARTDIAYGGTFGSEWREVTLPAHDAGGTRTVVRYELDGLLTESITTAHGTAAARTFTYEHDPDTLGVTKVTGPGGAVQEQTSYDDDGNVLSRTDAAGRTTTFAYADPDNPISPTSATDPSGNVSTMTYDDDGNLLTTAVPVVLESGTSTGTATTTFVRGDSAHPEDVTGIIGPDQHGQPTPKATTYSYRATDGQVEWVEDAEGNRTSYTYDSRGFLASTTTPKGNATGTVDDYTTTQAVNELGMVWSSTDPLDRTVRYVYDANGNVRFETDPAGHSTEVVYDAMNRPTVEERADGTQISTVYFPDGGVRQQVDGGGEITAYTYTAHGEVATETDANGRVTTYRYDALGRLAERIDPGGTCPSTSCTTYSYGSGNQLTAIAYSDPATPDVTAVTYDDLGQRTGVTRSSGGAQTWSRDSVGQLRSTTDPNGRTTAYGWTIGGDLASITYPGQPTPVTYAYDAAGRMTSVTDWDGRTTQLGWDDDGQWTTTTFPAAAGTTDTRTYDEAGRLSGVEWKKGTDVRGTLTYPRHDDGVIEAEITGPSSAVSFSHDERHQLTGHGLGTMMDIDDAGNLITTDTNEKQTFDDAHQLCVRSPLFPVACGTSPMPSDATNYAYDTRGNRTSMDEPGPTTWTYGYDQENRMTSAAESGAYPISSRTGVPVAGDYDDDGDDDVFWYGAGAAQDSVSWGGGDRDEVGVDASPFTFTGTGYEPFSGDFDGDGGDDIFWYAPGATADSIWFWANGGGTPYTTKAYSVGGDYTPVVGDFDADGYSDIYWYGAGATSDSIWWGNATVDTAGGAFTNQSVSQGGSYEPVAGDFDNNGATDIFWYQPGTGTDPVWFSTGTRNSWLVRNRTVNGTDWDLAAGDFDGDGRSDVFLTSASASQVWWGTNTTDFGITPVQWVLHATGYQTATGDLDDDGRDDLLLHDVDGPDTAYWGVATRADFSTAAHRGLGTDPHTSTYAYDAAGLRTGKTVDGTTTQFAWDTAGSLPLLLSQHVGSDTTRIVYGPGATPLYQVGPSGVTYYHQDQQGSTRLTTSSSGAVLARYEYGPYGDVTADSAPTVTRPLLGFDGQYTDAETGFVYLRARYLDPVTGQFTTRDPLVASTREPYSYASNSPVMRDDPTGLWPGEGLVDDVVDVVEDVGDAVEEGVDWVDDHKSEIATGLSVASLFIPGSQVIAVAAIGFSAWSAYGNAREGNYGLAALDALGVVGGLGALKYARYAGRLDDAAHYALAGRAWMAPWLLDDAARMRDRLRLFGALTTGGSYLLGELFDGRPAGAVGHQAC
jgi:RHS repeat-associated protein